MDHHMLRMARKLLAFIVIFSILPLACPELDSGKQGPQAANYLDSKESLQAAPDYLDSAPSAATEATQITKEASSAATEAPPARKEGPQADTEAPQATKEASSAATEVPPARKEGPQAATEAPPARKEGPQADTEAPQATKEASSAATEAPPACKEGPQADTEAPQANKEGPQAATEAPQASKEGPGAAKEAPQGRVIRDTFFFYGKRLWDSISGLVANLCGKVSKYVRDEASRFANSVWERVRSYEVIIFDAFDWFAKTTGYAVIMFVAARYAMKTIKRVRQRRHVVKRLGPNPDVDTGLINTPSKFLGEGGLGSAYVVMKQKKKWVMKRFNDVVVEKVEFQEKMEFIRGFGEHINVLALEAHHYSEYYKGVMYDYFEGGSLMSLLHGNISGGGRTLLHWERRVKIALGAARGIAHIHALGGPNFSHGNIKSSNVLINRQMEGVICDTGLVALMSSQVRRSSGYQAPEVSIRGRHTQAADVYSFGILLLELLSGKHPLQFPAREGMVDMTRVNWDDESRQQYDIQLRYPPQDVQEKMSKMLIIALDCIRSPVVYRPTMEHLVKQLQDITLPAATP